MIRTELFQIGHRRPQLAICVGVTSDLADRVEPYLRYLKEIDHPGLQVVVAFVEDEPWSEAHAKNAAVKAATTPMVVVSGIDDHPGVSLIERTIIELQRQYETVVVAMRLDGLPDYRAMPNPYALGDWLAMHKQVFLDIGGYDETLRQGAGWFENDVIARAIAASCDVVMLDERIYHSWHAVRVPDKQMQADSEWNLQSIMERGGGLALLYYPTVGLLRTKAGETSISVKPQLHSVVNITHHLPYNDDYWECIHHDKAIRLGGKNG